MFVSVLGSVGELCLQSSTSAADENKSTKTWSAWGGKVADLSKEKDQDLKAQKPIEEKDLKPFSSMDCYWA